MTINHDGSPGGMYLQDIVSSSILASTLFSFLTVFFFNTFDDIGIGRELFLPESTFTYTAIKCEPSTVLQQADASRITQREPRLRIGGCVFKTCHQANYVFMKEVEQISG